MRNSIRILPISVLTPNIRKMKDLEVGTVVQFKDKIEEYELELDSGMCAVFCGASTDRDGCLHVVFDTSLFEDFNKTVAKNTYYSPRGVAELTAWEANMWPANNKHSVYFESDAGATEYFEVCGKCSPNFEIIS